MLKLLSLLLIFPNFTTANSNVLTPYVGMRKVTKGTFADELNLLYGNSPIGKWGYFLQDDDDDSIWSLDMEITKSTTQIAAHCERNGQIDDSELKVASRVEGDQLIFESAAKAKGKIGCDYEVNAGPTRFDVRSTSLIFYDSENNLIIVFYRKTK